MWLEAQQTIEKWEFLGQSLKIWLLLGILLIIALLLKRFVARLVLGIIHKAFKNYTPDSCALDFVKAIKRPVELLFLLIVIRFAVVWLQWPLEWQRYLLIRSGTEKAFNIIFGIGVIWLSVRIILLINNFFFQNYIAYHQKAQPEKQTAAKQLAPFLKESLRFSVIIFAFLVLLAWVFHINVGAMVAGLGIGGLAVALAGKETLENLFASFTIFADKPFAVGDFVQSGQLSGTVEQVGFRSTRLRSLDKTYITLPNKIMVDQPLNNMSRRSSQPTRIRICLAFDTPIHTLETVIEECRQILNAQEPSISPDHHVFIKELRDQGIDLQLYWHVQTMNFMEYNKTNHHIFFQILKTFRSHNCPVWIPSEWKKMTPDGDN